MSPRCKGNEGPNTGSRKPQHPEIHLGQPPCVTSQQRSAKHQRFGKPSQGNPVATQIAPQGTRARKTLRYLFNPFRNKRSPEDNPAQENLRDKQNAHTSQTQSPGSLNTRRSTSVSSLASPHNKSRRSTSTSGKPSQGNPAAKQIASQDESVSKPGRQDRAST